MRTLVSPGAKNLPRAGVKRLVRRLWSFASRRFRELAAIATVLGIAGALWSERKALLDFDWRLAPVSFVAAIVLFAVAPYVQAASFWLMLRLLGLDARLSEALLLWMRSFLLRYAPSGALQLVIRIRERRRFAASTQDVWLVSGYENLAGLCAGAFVCVAAFALAGGWPPLLAIVIAGVALAVAVAVRPAFFRRWARALLERRGLELPSLLRGRELALVILLNTLGWLATGGAAYLLVRALVTHPNVSPVWLTAAYSFAWLVGFVVPLLPGGLGLRDGVLVALLASRIGAGPATAVALALRLAATLGELLAIAITEAAYGMLRVLGRTAPLPAPEDAKGGTPLRVIPDHESPVRHMVAAARGRRYEALKSLDDAKLTSDAAIVMEGDYGGSIYLTCPARLVRCDESTLRQLLLDLDEYDWNDPDGVGLYYEVAPAGSGIVGGTGGGIVTDGVWLHPVLEAEGLRERVEAVVAGERERLGA